MNWLGDMLQKFVHKNDIVLDLECGVMQATTTIIEGKENLNCKTVVGVDIQNKYLDKIKGEYPTINTDVLAAPQLFNDKSYDVVLCLDVLEHLTTANTSWLLVEMKRIARKSVVIYTPKEFKENEEHVDNAWGLGDNPYQKHQCLIKESMLHEHGYRTMITKIDGNILGVWQK